MGTRTSNLKLIRPCDDGTFMLTLFITMDYPLHIDTISMDLFIQYFKGFPVV